MSKLTISQQRSGEGWILTDVSGTGPEVLAGELSDLLEGGILLVASEDFESWTPPGGEVLEPGLHALPPEAGRALLRDARSWTGRRAIFAIVTALPDEDARRRWIPQALRPWDPERLRARAYGQYGRRFAHRGLWFASERDRARLVTIAVEKVVTEAGHRLPNGDVTLVLETPTDSTFEAEFKASGRGDAFALHRDFPSRGLSRDWTIRRGEWEAVERRRPRADGRGFKARAVQALASAAIFLLAIPTFLFVGLVALVARLTNATTSPSVTSKRVDEKTRTAA